MDAPQGVFVDHINGNPSDNRRENLRFCTHAQNMQNSKVRSHSSTGVKGVQKHKNRYRALIRRDGKQVRLGSFTTIEEAKACYDAAALETFGEFARKH
ncbi:HNH endonuclease [Curvibacter phage P26059B]|uniref:HNH endonuclease n=1 Tax=Curvibacter phage P26059B TaxID=1983784 RepID=A0A384UJ79_9CAUD|nr:HNH endonuclease [Curvibacter phage P26059B]ASJ79287.1 HNH endonuclease [Curvibacter phage P26059B]